MKDIPSDSSTAQIPPPVPPKATNSASAVLLPEKLECGECKQVKPPKDFWWCRSCQKTLCCGCNLIQGHTEHRTVPWRPDELVRSLIDSIEARCVARQNRAAEEEAAVKEYTREIEKYFLNKLQCQVNERNEEDRALVSVVCAGAGVNAGERKRWPPASRFPPAASNASPPPQSVAFDLLTDDSVARLVNEIGRLLPTDCARTLTVTKSPRTASARNSACSSPQLGADRRSLTVCKVAHTFGPEDSRGCSSNSSNRFPAVLPDIDPVEFARLLEQQGELTPRSRSRSQSGARNQQRSSTPFLEHVSSRAGSPLQGVNGNTLSIYGTLDVDAADSGPASARDITINDASTITTRAVIHQGKEPVPRQLDTEAASTVQLMISENTQTSASWLTSATQTDATGNGAVPMTSTANGSQEGPQRDSDGMSGSAETSTESAKSTGDDSISRSMSITAFHFGDDYLTRPIDVQPLPDGKLAVSDSCGGLYITNANGEVMHQVWLEGFSASSLCYLATNRSAADDRYPPLLLVSVLRKHDRCVNFYGARDFTLLDTVVCPNEPQIDLGRSRWLAADDRGAVFLVTGDGKVSALWKYYPATKGWTLLKRAPKTRYQYLDVVHTMTDPTSVTLLTCDGLRGSLLLITISRTSSSNGYNKILAEEDFSQTYGLGRFIPSPASAVVDYQGNMLILDYSTGKLWLLRAPISTTGKSSSDTSSDRRLKMLVEIGPQQAIGLSVSAPLDGYRPYGDHWCYLACYNKKRVHAVKYLSD